jgi:hypothetical protein
MAAAARNSVRPLAMTSSQVSSPYSRHHRRCMNARAARTSCRSLPGSIQTNHRCVRGPTRPSTCVSPFSVQTMFIHQKNGVRTSHVLPPQKLRTCRLITAERVDTVQTGCPERRITYPNPGARGRITPASFPAASKTRTSRKAAVRRIQRVPGLSSDASSASGDFIIRTDSPNPSMIEQ